MADEQKQTPANEQDRDVSKAQATQQPAGQAGQQAEFGQDRSNYQADEGQQGETATRQDTDIEGTSQSPEKGEPESGFVGSQGKSDSSSELVEEDDITKGDGE